MRSQPAIVGVGLSDLARRPGPHAGRLAKDAIDRAAADAGLSGALLDGVLLNISPLAAEDVKRAFGPSIQASLGLPELKRLSVVDSQGATVGVMLQLASLWLQHEGLRAVACVFADTPLTTSRRGSTAFAGKPLSLTGIDGLDELYGIFGAPSLYALLASRYMHETGVTEEDLAQVAVTNRQWASGNERALLRTPISVDDYFDSRYVVKPLRLLDCALPVNGAAAVIVARPEVVAGAARPPVYIAGYGQGHRPVSWRRGREFGGQSGAALAAREAYGTARMGPSDIDVVEIYDPFSFVSLVMLEQYGFCDRGEARHLYADGLAGPGGKLPVNTGGGQTAAYYLQGFTPLVEALHQLRGEAPGHQVDGASVGLVTFSGGMLEHHACLILTNERPS